MGQRVPRMGRPTARTEALLREMLTDNALDNINFHEMTS
jgi:hypothetical protein